jgi:hypothetical protein
MPNLFGTRLASASMTVILSVKNGSAKGAPFFARSAFQKIN